MLVWDSGDFSAVQNYTFLIVITLVVLGIGIQLGLFRVFQRVAPVVEAFAHRHGLRPPSRRTVAYVLVAVVVLASLVRPIRNLYWDWEYYRGFQESIAEEPDLEVMSLTEGELKSIERTWRRLDVGDASWLNKDLELIGLSASVSSAIALANGRMAPYSWWNAAANRSNMDRAFKRWSLRSFYFDIKRKVFHLSADQKTLVVYSDVRPYGFGYASIFRDSERGIELSEWYRPEKDIEPAVGADSR
jgi:hypothetical protein